jgi:SAM-dependent methyltransferase
MRADDLREHYEDLFRKYGDSPEAVQYSSLDSQSKRFQILTEISDLNGSTVLDFGCGLGHLGSYLVSRGVHCCYNGVDIAPSFIDHCRGKFVDGNFGYLNDFSGKGFDFVFVSGVFNNRIQDNWNFFRETIACLFEMTRVGLAFNCMSTYVDYKEEGLYYIEPQKVFHFLKTEVTPFVTIRNDYYVKPGVLPFDFSVYAFREGR